MVMPSLFTCIVSAFDVSTLPIRNGNFRNRTANIAANVIREYLTYKEWKHGQEAIWFLPHTCEYLTYKEWKL